VRIYLRTMGSIKLLSREGEIAIAKRIEAGREAMIAGLWRARSPSSLVLDKDLCVSAAIGGAVPSSA
jgi:hypothetical protein